MAYTLPQFNLTFDVWKPGNTPAGGPADYFGIAAQMYLMSRADADRDEAGNPAYVPAIIIRTDNTIPVLQVGVVNKTIWYYQDSAGFKNYYLVRWYNIVHAGFSNEYWMLVCDQCDDNGITPDSRRG